MPTPPRFVLSPGDAKWGRWVTEQLQKLAGETARAATNIQAANRGAAASVEQGVVTQVQLEQVGGAVAGHSEILDAPAPPFPPSAPSLESKLSTVIATWDGLLEDYSDEEAEQALPTSPTSGFKGVIAEISETGAADSIWTQAGVGRPDAGEIYFTRPIGERVYVRLVALNWDGTRSEPSAVAWVDVIGIDEYDLEESVRETIDNAFTIATETSAVVGGAIASSLDEYVVSDSNTVAPTSGWSPDTPDWEPGEYVWRRTKNTHIDGSISYSAPAVITGNDGAPGADAVLLRVSSSRGTSFKNNAISTVLSVTVFHGSTRITNITDLRATFGAGAFIEWWWRRKDDADFGVISSSDPRLSQAGFALTVSPADVDEQTVFEARLNT